MKLAGNKQLRKFHFPTTHKAFFLRNCDVVYGNTHEADLNAQSDRWSLIFSIAAAHAASPAAATFNGRIEFVSNSEPT